MTTAVFSHEEGNTSGAGEERRPLLTGCRVSSDVVDVASCSIMYHNHQAHHWQTQEME